MNKAKHKVTVVKAVMFVPYTHGSRLAKKLREAEQTMENREVGCRLEDLLHKSDPWEGKLCGRQRCLLCKTKKETGKFGSQLCTK